MRKDSRTSGFFTLIELLALIFIFTFTTVIGKSVTARYGAWAGVGVGFLAALSSLSVVVLFYRWTWRRDRQRLKIRLRQSKPACFSSQAAR